MASDYISREAVLNTLDTMDKALDENRTVEAYKELLKECYKELPPVTLAPIECDDAVSREAVMKLKSHKPEYGDMIYAFDVELLPPVTPKQRTGKWIKQKIGYGCSNCTLCTNDYGVGIYKFCPNCGTKMEGESE